LLALDRRFNYPPPRQKSHETMTKLIDTRMNLAEAAQAATAPRWPDPVADGRRFGYQLSLAGRRAG
jgi:hypothetical protein